MGGVIGEVGQREDEPGDPDRDRGIRPPLKRRHHARPDEGEVERTDVADEVLVERTVHRDPGGKPGAGERSIERFGQEQGPEADEGSEEIERPQQDASRGGVHTC